MIFLIIVAGVLLCSYGIFNYVTAMLQSKGKPVSPRARFITQIAIGFSVAGFALIFGVLTLRSPEFVFEAIDGGWVVAVGIALSVFLVLIAILWLNEKYTRSLSLSLIAVGVCVLVMTLFGNYFAEERGYDFSDEYPYATYEQTSLQPASDLDKIVFSGDMSDMMLDGEAK